MAMPRGRSLVSSDQQRGEQHSDGGGVNAGAQVAVGRAARIDGLDKVTGAARYAADLSRPGMLRGLALRSPYPHARILSIDTTATRALPGVHAVLVGTDLPPDAR